MDVITKLKLPIIILTIIFGSLLFGEAIPEIAKSFFYGISLSIKNLIVFVLPFIIFSFLFGSLINLGSRAAGFVLLLLTVVFLSNLTAILTGYFIGESLLSFFDIQIKLQDSMGEKLLPLWYLDIPRLVRNEPAMILGIVLGVVFSIKKSERVTKFSYFLNSASLFILRKLFLPVLPLFILGFIFKLQHEKILESVLEQYMSVLMVVVMMQLAYIVALYSVAARFSVKKIINYLLNIFPAIMTAFSTISSAATMPVTIMCTEKNLGDKILARTIIPTTANIHTLGSALGVTILTLGTMTAFNMPLPDFSMFITFALFYAMSKFAVAGIPGGVILVVTPLLETYLGFTPDMIGLITALYILFDPFGTATNVACNGAFAIIFTRLQKKMGILEYKDPEEMVAEGYVR